jgi:hypothetical protein
MDHYLVNGCKMDKQASLSLEYRFVNAFKLDLFCYQILQHQQCDNDLYIEKQDQLIGFRDFPQIDMSCCP